jgi:hypothetical protein
MCHATISTRFAHGINGSKLRHAICYDTLPSNFSGGCMVVTVETLKSWVVLQKLKRKIHLRTRERSKSETRRCEKLSEAIVDMVVMVGRMIFKRGLRRISGCIWNHYPDGHHPVWSWYVAKQIRRLDSPILGVQSNWLVNDRYYSRHFRRLGGESGPHSFASSTGYPRYQ